MEDFKQRLRQFELRLLEYGETRRFFLNNEQTIDGLYAVDAKDAQRLSITPTSASSQRLRSGSFFEEIVPTLSNNAALTRKHAEFCGDLTFSLSSLTAIFASVLQLHVCCL